MEIVRLENVSKDYPLGAHRVQALTDISFTIEAGVPHSCLDVESFAWHFCSCARAKAAA